MKKLLLLVVMLTLAAGAGAATLVLKGGKKLDVTGLQRQGNYVVVKYANGRVESYPVSAVDLDATNAVNAAPAPAVAPAPVTPTGPHSPFFGAQSNPGKPVVVVTDDDVQHVVPPDEAEGGAESKAVQPRSAEGQVVLVDYAKQKADDGTWEITATVRNAGSGVATDVTADVRLLDAKGGSLGSGTASLAGPLAPTQEAAMTTKIASPSEPVQIGFSFHWQTVTPAPAPEAGADSDAKAGTSPKVSKQPAVAVKPVTPVGFSVPPGSSPNTLPSNQLAVPTNLTSPPTSLQVQRPDAAPPAPKA